MIDELVEDLKIDEGWVPHAYQDHLGFWTLGYGFLIDERRGGRIPEPIAEQWLAYEVSQRWAQLTSERPWILELPEEVHKALGNMSYQLGVNGVLNFKRMMLALFIGDRFRAAEEALDSRWAKQTPARAKRVAAMIRGND